VRWPRIGAIVVVVASCGCSERPLSALIRVSAPPDENPDELRVSLFAPRGALVRDVLIARPQLPGTIGVRELPIEQTIRIAISSGPHPLQGSATFIVYAGLTASAQVILSPAVDPDQDGVPSDIDNCPTVPNPDQEDRDGRAPGDACEAGVDLAGLDLQPDLASQDLTGADLAGLDLQTSPDLLPPPVLIGHETAETQTDSLAAGKADSWKFTALTSGMVRKIYLYVDTGNASDSILLGLYADGGTAPGTFLSSGSVDMPLKAPLPSWNSATLSTPQQVTAGTVYWLAMLSPSGHGAIAFRTLLGSGTTERETTDTNLTTMPLTWNPGAMYDASACIYATP
jgi:hypothetical protein